MSKLTTIPGAVAALVASDAPVLCLDTCDFLDVVRGVAEGSLTHAESFRSLQEHLATSPRPIRVVITYLVRHEWGQNKGSAVEKVDGFLRDLAKRFERVGEARRLARLPVPSRGEPIVDSALSRTLLGLAESILDHSIVLEKHEPCIARALERVMDHRRPSHKNEIKDSIHWEHYLEFSGQLKASGHAEPRIFVSANRDDFWAEAKQPAIHPDLKAEADAAGLQFSGKLDQALRILDV